MIYDYLLADFKQLPSYPIWIEHLTKKVFSVILQVADPRPFTGE